VNTLVGPENTWVLWGVMVVGVAACIWLEQNMRWAARTGGPVLALVGGMILSNSLLLPAGCGPYDVVDDYLAPVAIPLLLFRANLGRIFRGTGPMFLAFHVASVGTILGAFLAAFLFRGAFPRVAEVAGVMTGSYTGGGVNFVAIAKSYRLNAELTNPLLVADNSIMAGIFAVLFVLAGNRFMRRHYPHPHSQADDATDSQALAAQYWQRKDIALLDLAKAIGIAVGIVAVAVQLTDAIKTLTESKLLLAFFANSFVLITFCTVILTTLFPRAMERVHGAEELGAYLLYIFFFVIGLRADVWQVILNVPVLFGFCLVMACTNLVFTLSLGRLLRLNLEELLLSVNATLGGAPSAAAMAISLGWSKLVLPGILAGIWGYVIGTPLGIALAETLLRL